MKLRTLVPAILVASLSQASVVLPVDSNPISNASTTPGLTIVSAAAEDNVDPTTKDAIDDRLQVSVRNDSASELTAFEIYYVMTDVTTGRAEAYYLDLMGFSLPANSEATLSFDGETGPGHFPENQFSIYRTSPNQVDFTIEVSAAGVQVAHATATKGSGIGDAAD
jgi:hypothetical protein